MSASKSFILIFHCALLLEQISLIDMAQDYSVQDGDCISSIAYTFGFLPDTIWNLPENSDLKLLRKDPNVLMPGDTVHIPDLTVQDFPRPTDHGVPEKLCLRLLDINQKPRVNLAYTLVVDGRRKKGTTDGEGKLTESIAPNAKEGKILVGADGSEVIRLQLGQLNPVADITGVKARLSNLGYYQGPIDNNVDDQTTKAISDYQTKQGLPVTGTADDATQSQLLQDHGH